MESLGEIEKRRDAYPSDLVRQLCVGLGASHPTILIARDEGFWRLE